MDIILGNCKHEKGNSSETSQRCEIRSEKKTRTIGTSTDSITLAIVVAIDRANMHPYCTKRTLNPWLAVSLCPFFRVRRFAVEFA